MKSPSKQQLLLIDNFCRRNHPCCKALKAKLQEILQDNQIYMRKSKKQMEFIQKMNDSLMEQLKDTFRKDALANNQQQIKKQLEIVFTQKIQQLEIDHKTQLRKQESIHQQDMQKKQFHHKENLNYLQKHNMECQQQIQRLTLNLKELDSKVFQLMNQNIQANRLKQEYQIKSQELSNLNQKINNQRLNKCHEVQQLKMTINQFQRKLDENETKYMYLIQQNQQNFINFKSKEELSKALQREVDENHLAKNKLLLQNKQLLIIMNHLDNNLHEQRNKEFLMTKELMETHDTLLRKSQAIQNIKRDVGNLRYAA